MASQPTSALSVIRSHSVVCAQITVVAASAIFLSTCGRPSSAANIPTVTKPAPQPAREVRATGSVQAVHYFVVQTPNIAGQGGQINGQLTLIHLVENGTKVKQGDMLAEFDSTAQQDNARDASSKYDDLAHQVDQKVAQNRADAEKRTSELQSAEADLAKATIELRKGPLLAEIDRLKNEAKLRDAEVHVDSLKKSNQFHDQSDAAALRVLELQRDRQKVALDRAKRNMEKLLVKAPLAGVVALENIWRNGSFGHAQEGDQLWRGQALVRIFDPSQMQVRTTVGEPDGAVLQPGCRAKVYLDAYPDLLFEARFVSASPVAASNLGSPIKNFTAIFAIDKSDPHLMPDLSAAVVVEPEATK
jgi:multidrug efflux pump subunit AcrA (membrane-fusion protein)